MINTSRGKKIIMIALIALSAIAFLLSGLAVAGNIKKNNNKALAASGTNLADYSNLTKSAFSTYYSKSDAYFYIDDVADLEFFSKTIGEWGFNYASLHVYLCNDLDLDGGTMYPIGLGLDDTTSETDDYRYVPFAGFFYGQGHTIENFTITMPTYTAGIERMRKVTGRVVSVGFFGEMTGISTVSELRLNNISIDVKTPHFENVGTIVYYDPLQVGGIVGTHWGAVNGTAEINQCAVENLEIDIHYMDLAFYTYPKYIGGIAGALGWANIIDDDDIFTTANVRHCYVKNFSITHVEKYGARPTSTTQAYLYAGGIVGGHNQESTIAYSIFNGTIDAFKFANNTLQPDIPGYLSLYNISPRDYQADHVGNCYYKDSGEKIFSTLRSVYSYIWFFDADYNEGMPYLYCFLDLDIYEFSIDPQGKGVLEYNESDYSGATNISGITMQVKLPKDFEPDVKEEGNVYRFGNYKTVTATPYDSYYVFYRYIFDSGEDIGDDTYYYFTASFKKEYFNVTLEISTGLTLDGANDNVFIKNVKLGSIVYLDLLPTTGHIEVRVKTGENQLSFSRYDFDAKINEVIGYKINAVSKSKDLTEYEIIDDTKIQPILGVRSNTITYDLDGGTNHPSNPNVYYYNSPAITLKDPTQTGYIFKHWSTSWNGEECSIPHIPQNSYGDKKFYAIWEIITYNITYELDGGINSASNIRTYTVEDNVTLYNPQKYGYNFNGWLDESGNIVTGIAKGSTGDKHFTAQWGPLEYKINYNLNLGINHEDNPSVYTKEDEITLKNPTRQNHDFVGWYLDSNLTQISSEPQIPIGSTGTKYFYAKWELIEYTITYNLDGGELEEGKTNPTTYTVATSSFTLNNPIKEGYVFAGWTGTDLEDLTTKVTIEYGSTGDREYTANWIDGVSVTYKWVENTYLNEGHLNTVDTGTKDLYTQIQFNEILYITTWSTLGEALLKVKIVGSDQYITYVWDSDRYTVTGWNINGEIYSTDTDIEYMVTKDTVISPVLEGETYKISYNLYYSGVDNSMNPTTYTFEDEITLQDPIKEGCKFMGWYLDSNLTQISSEPQIPIGSTGTKYFYAKWELIEYTITYNLDGGELEEGKTNPITYTVETASFTLENPIKTGAFFAGWVGTGLDTASPLVSIPYGSTGDREYTATWAETFSVTFKWVENTYLGEGYEENYGDDDLIYFFRFTNKLKLITWPSTGEADIDIRVGTEDKRITYYWDTSKYSVTGWNMNGDIVPVRDTEYDGTSYSYEMTQSVVIFPIVEPIRFKISYISLDIENIDNSMNPTTYTCEDEITLKNPTRKGYIFEGWYLDVLHSTITTTPQITKGSVGNKTFFAEWKAEVYNISYVLDGATDPGNRITYTIESSTFTLLNPSKPHYEFIGWTGTDLNEPTLIVTIDKGSMGNREYTAVFVDARYKVSFIAEGVNNIQIKVLKNGVLDYQGSGEYVVNDVWTAQEIKFTVNRATNTYVARIEDYLGVIYTIEYIIESKYTLNSYYVFVDNVEMIIDLNTYTTTKDCEIIARFTRKSYGVNYD